MKTRCHCCNVTEGKLHKQIPMKWDNSISLEFCDMEICPKCKEQLLSCDCNIQNISINKKLLKIGNKSFKREPYFRVPNICFKCGKLYPNFFNTSNKEWNRVCGITFPKDCILCKSCFNQIKKSRRIKWKTQKKKV